VAPKMTGRRGEGTRGKVAGSSVRIESASERSRGIVEVPSISRISPQRKLRLETLTDSSASARLPPPPPLLPFPDIGKKEVARPREGRKEDADASGINRAAIDEILWPRRGEKGSPLGRRRVSFQPVSHRAACVTVTNNYRGLT